MRWVSSHRKLTDLTVFLCLPGLVFLGTAAAKSPGPPVDPDRQDIECLDKATTQKTIDECFHHSTTVQARKLSLLVKELEERLAADQFAELHDNQTLWRYQVVAQCRWESTFFSRGSMAQGVLSRCVGQHVERRVERLKKFLCEGAGATGPCQASQKY